MLVVRGAYIRGLIFGEGLYSGFYSICLESNIGVIGAPYLYEYGGDDVSHLTGEL